MLTNTLRFGPLTNTCAHLCVDMQRIFAEATPWHMPWTKKVLPNVLRIVEAQAAQTFFTRFVPVKSVGQGHGTWCRYYEHWHRMTLDHIDPDLINLITPLNEFVPPATVIDKHVYSPWFDTNLHLQLQQRHINTLVITGGEIDVCIASTVAGAIDLGYRVILTSDALCSSTNQTYDAMMEIYRKRYSMQIELANSADLLEQWRN